MADKRVPTVDEILDSLTVMLGLAQVYVGGIKDREQLVRSREAEIPRLDAEIQARVDRIVVLDRERRVLDEKLVQLRDDHQREQLALGELQTARLSEAAQVDAILQELASLEGRIVERKR